jgi:hypothetical protein
MYYSIIILDPVEIPVSFDILRRVKLLEGDEFAGQMREPWVH